MKVLLIDFQDSFSFNIQHYIESLDVSCEVISDGEVDFEEIPTFDAVILSPGPGLPAEKLQLFDFLAEFNSNTKIFGICLGMQGIVEFFGGDLENQDKVKHGVSEKIKLSKDSKLFIDLPEVFKVGLYHSWAVKVVPEEFVVTAISENNVIMAVEHITKPIYGVQFHPESVMTENGKEILKNFLFQV